MQNRIDELRSLLRAEPGSRRFFQLGDLLRKVGSYTEAAEVLGRGLKYHPRYTAAWISLGRVQLELGEYPEAETSFARALELDPENPVSARLLGDTAAARGEYVRAIKAYKLARALGDPELDERIDEVGAQISSGSAEAAADAPFEEDSPEADEFDEEPLVSVEHEEELVEIGAVSPEANSGRAAKVVVVFEEDPFALGGQVPAEASGEDVFALSSEFETADLPGSAGEDVFGPVSLESVGDEKQELLRENEPAVEKSLEEAEADEDRAGGPLQEDIAVLEPAVDELPVEDESAPIATLTLAKMALEQNDRPMAESILRTLLLKEPENSEAAGLLSRLSRGAEEDPQEESLVDPGRVGPEIDSVPVTAAEEIGVSAESGEEAAVSTASSEGYSAEAVIRRKIVRLDAWLDGLKRVSERAG